MALDPAVDARIAERLRAAGVDQRHEVMVIHVSAGNPFRRWPEPAFATLVAGLAARDARRRIVLSSGPSDCTAADRIASTARQQLGPARAGQVLEFGDVDLAELRALVERSAIFVGGDSGPLHIAVDDDDADRRDLRSDAVGAIGALARSGNPDRVGRNRGSALPPVRTAGLCAGRFPLPHTDRAER